MEGPLDGRGMRGQAGPGLRATLHCLRWGCPGSTVLLGVGRVGWTPARMDQEGGQRVRPRGLDPAWLLLAFRPRSSPRLLRLLQRAGPELGRPSWGGVPLRRRSAATWKAGGGDVASAALAGRPGLWEARRGESWELRAERNGAQLFAGRRGRPCVIVN